MNEFAPTLIEKVWCYKTPDRYYVPYTEELGCGRQHKVAEDLLEVVNVVEK